MNNAHYDRVRATALEERVIDSFIPDKGGVTFAEFGGTDRAALYVGPMGNVVHALRMDEDIALPCYRRAMILRAQGMLALDNEHFVFTAYQPEFFAANFIRVLSDGSTVARLSQPVIEQGKAMIALNRQIQDKLVDLMGASLKRTLKFRKTKKERENLNALSDSLAAHMADLKHLTQLGKVAKAAMEPTVTQDKKEGPVASRASLEDAGHASSGADSATLDLADQNDQGLTHTQMNEMGEMNQVGQTIQLGEASPAKELSEA